jgi:arylsulfatase
MRLDPLKPILSIVVIMALGSGSAASEADQRPNMLLIIADDLGYADLGVYGGDIDTPNIDSLAERGILLTQFHASPLCAPTRAMLFSGNNNHVAGMANQGQTGVLDFPLRGYENRLSDRIVPFPRLLRDAGYHTYIVGKWHLGESADSSPKAAGFTRSYVLLQGAGTHFDARGFEEEGSTYWHDDDFTDYPTGHYSTEVYTDRLIEFLESGKGDGKPFLAVAAYTSPHWPLQVPPDYRDLYAGRYDDGYDALRERRFSSLKAAGIIPKQWTLPPRNAAITPWDQLDADERRQESRKMELYAAMVDNLDDHVGRLLAYLEKNGLQENTLVIFLSDNGAAGEDFYNSGPFKDYVRENFDNSYKNMGEPGSFVSYGPPWAEAGSAPFNSYKAYTREGGLVAPMIIAGRTVAHRRGIDSTYVTVMDVAPTLLELAGAAYPEDDKLHPMLGESMAAWLAGDASRVHDDNYVTTLYHHGRAYLRQGDWKISTEDAPFDESKFELHDLSADPGETTDLATEQPDRYDAMVKLWRSERKRLGIVLPEDL